MQIKLVVGGLTSREAFNRNAFIVSRMGLQQGGRGGGGGGGLISGILRHTERGVYQMNQPQIKTNITYYGYDLV